MRLRIAPSVPPATACDSLRYVKVVWERLKAVAIGLAVQDRTLRQWIRNGRAVGRRDGAKLLSVLVHAEGVNKGRPLTRLEAEAAGVDVPELDDLTPLPGPAPTADDGELELDQLLKETL